MRGDPALWKFLSKWLALRREDTNVKSEAIGLQKALTTLVQDDMPRKFLDGMTGRVSQLKSLLSEIDGDHKTPTPSPGSARSRWLREARRIVARWDESAWVSTALELSAERNPLMLAAVSQSLEESTEKGQGNRELAENLRKLRTLDEREFRAIPVPPCPRAPWDPASYVFPAVGGRVAARVQHALADFMDTKSADPATLAPAKALSDVLQLIEGGWPVPRSRIEGPLRQLADLSPVGSDGAVAFHEALHRIDPGNNLLHSAAVPPDARTASTADLVLARARDRIDELARALQSESSTNAHAFGRRLNEVVALPGSATAQGLHQELVGCLASLDGSDDSAIANRWRLSTLERIAGTCQDLGGGEILNKQLVGRPLGRWTEFVTIVSNDDETFAGESRRITRVERIGYCVVFSDGERRALVRARVRTSN